MGNFFSKTKNLNSELINEIKMLRDDYEKKGGDLVKLPSKFYDSIADDLTIENPAKFGSKIFNNRTIESYIKATKKASNHLDGDIIDPFTNLPICKLSEAHKYKKTVKLHKHLVELRCELNKTIQLLNHPCKKV